MDAFTQLMQEHQEAKRQLETLINECESMDETQCRQQMNHLFVELQNHMSREETILYPVIEQHTNLDEKVEHSYEEHTELKSAINDLSNNTYQTRMLKQRLEKMMMLMEHHVREEEDDVFPKARTSLDQKVIREVSDEMMLIKREEQQGVPAFI
jgi:iron-sulfur cluster repair protein YtfE (RIC family)